MQENELTVKNKFDRHDRIIWILLVCVLWYIFILSGFEMFISTPGSIFFTIAEAIGYEVDATKFVIEYYLGTIAPFIGFIVYTLVTKRNRFVLRSILPGHEGNRFSMLLWGLLVGFLMNFSCIACALANGDIKLYLSFAASQIPFYIFALICVFIQSSSEEMWCRGFVYERINVRYPLWVAIVVNGLFFGALHVFNPGASFLPIADIVVCGLSFSLAKWYTRSIWFPMGIHTAWNFTQNLLFGLPNSGLVSEASVYSLDAANARDSLVYNVDFGVEGAFPAVLADLLLGVICLLLAAKNGRLKELTQIKGRVYEADLPVVEDGNYHYSQDLEESREFQEGLSDVTEEKPVAGSKMPESETGGQTPGSEAEVRSSAQMPGSESEVRSSAQMPGSENGERT